MPASFVKQMGRIVIDYDPEYDGTGVSVFCVDARESDTAPPHENLMSLETARDLHYALGRLLDKIDNER